MNNTWVPHAFLWSKKVGDELGLSYNGYSKMWLTGIAVEPDGRSSMKTGCLKHRGRFVEEERKVSYTETRYPPFSGVARGLAACTLKGYMV